MSAKKGVIRLLLFDERRLVRDALRCLVETQSDLRVVGATGDHRDIVPFARKWQPQVAIVHMYHRLDEFDVLREMANAQLPVLVLTASLDKTDATAALRAGARGILLTTASAALLFKSIRSIAGGQYWIGRQAVADLVETIRQLRPTIEASAPARPYGLTPREIDIIAAVVASESNRVIAQRFSLSEDTVKHHLTHIFDKVGVFSRLELALFALHHHLVQAGDQHQPTTT